MYESPLIEIIPVAANDQPTWITSGDLTGTWSDYVEGDGSDLTTQQY
jgi:hypothetical protein